MYDAIQAETVTVRGDGGDEIEAYLARPMSPGPHGGVVVLHHMPGYDEQTKEIARIEAENKALEELLKKANETIPTVKKALPEKHPKINLTLVRLPTVAQLNY